MKKLFVLITFCFFISKINAQNFAEFRFMTEPVKYLNDNNWCKGLLCLIPTKDAEYSVIRHTTWILLDSVNGNRFIAHSDYNYSSFPIGIYEIKASEDSKFLAVYYVTEGHPLIDIIDLEKLIQLSTYTVLTTINPYPGIVNITEWKNGKLIVTSDMNLLDLNTKQSCDANSMHNTNDVKYSFNPATKKFELVK